MTTDHSDNLAEFHDPVMEERWEVLRPGVCEVVVGIGAQILGAATSAKVVAVELSRMMRAALMVRVAGDRALAEELAGAGLTLTVAGSSWGLVCEDAR